MVLEEITKELETSDKPVAQMLQKGTDFQILGKGPQKQTTLSFNFNGEDIVLMRKGEDLNLLGIGFRKNMLLSRHRSLVPARLVVLQGEVVYNNDSTATILGQYDEHEIPVEEPHWVEAREDSMIVVVKGQ